MDFRFDGKTALVTGAGKSIGRAIAKALLEGGAKTYALSRTEADLDSLKQECPGMHTVCVDLADWDATRKAVQDIGAIDLLVNNAGAFDLAGFMDVTEEVLDRALSIDIKAAFNVSQVVAKGMIERGQGGSIVNISSIASKVVLPGLAAHCTTKAALDQLTRVMTLELGPHQIRANAVNPTWVNTPKAVAMRSMGGPIADATARDAERTPQKKLAEMHDVVRPVLYLLSDKSDMINGTTLLVDGGFTIC